MTALASGVIDRTERRWPATAMVRNLVRRYRKIGGPVIAGNLAFRFFVWLLPTLVLMIAIASISASRGVDVAMVGTDQLRVGGTLADALSTSAEETRSSGWQAGVVAVVAMVYASSVLVSALHAAAVLGWGLPPDTPKRRGKVTVRLLAALTLISAMIAVNVALRDSGPLLNALSHVLGFAAAFALLVGLFVSLPRLSTRWYWTVPGAAVGAAGYVVLQAYAVIWLPRTIESKSTTYGTIGIAASTLGYLFLIGTLVVVATLVNVVWWEYHRAVAAGHPGGSGRRVVSTAADLGMMNPSPIRGAAMVHRHVHDDATIAPAYAGRFSREPVPKNALPETEAPAEAVYRLIHDELLLDGSSRLNMATFVTTWMEPEAERLMAESFDKNMIDKDEYPQTAEIERRCVNIVADLFNAPTDGDAVGVSTIGSSEAVMLGGLAMKWNWRRRREAAGLSTDRPNMVMGSNVQVVWEKFCRYWDVEARYVPVAADRFVVDPDDVMQRVDENTIGVIPILGTTYTGEFEPIEEIHDRVVAHNAEHGLDIPIHVDAASGGFVAPFLHPELAWDFRLPQVKSINVSGHKYGLTYPGIGFVIWRSQDDLPEDLVFHVNYLGGDMPTFTLNFSRPGNQIVGQYYNFVRLGREGYTAIMELLRDVAVHLSTGIAQMGPFEVVSDGTAIPVLAFKVKDPDLYTVFHVSDQLRMAGWQVPAYTMPADATDVAVLRVVVREGFGMDLADSLLEELAKAVAHLTAHPPAHAPIADGFSHT